MFGLTFCFLLSRNKNTKNMFSNENIFLDLLKITFLVTTFSFYPKWGSWFKLKTRFYCFQFFVRFGKYFQWKWKHKSNQTHFHRHFSFLVKMKTENNQTKHPLKGSHQRAHKSQKLYNVVILITIISLYYFQLDNIFLKLIIRLKVTFT